MPTICYTPRQFKPRTMRLINLCIDIIEEYEDDGLDLTLRQLYYQLVARDVIPNTQRSYNRLGDIVNNARMAGLIDWASIEDRTRFIRRGMYDTDPQRSLTYAADSYVLDHWRLMDTRVEVWIEKDALIGVIQPICRTMHLPHFSCRGYVSQSEMWTAAQRIIERHDGAEHHRGASQKTVILHLGDHDPSGIDMSRDIRDRLTLFCTDPDDGELLAEFEVHRIALNMAQIREHNPPPNPAKITDSRATVYIERFGPSSWELDAMEPRTMQALIRSEVSRHVDRRLWDAVSAQQVHERAVLAEIAHRLPEVQEHLGI